MTHFADHQYGVYLQGLAGVVPELPMGSADLEAAATAALAPGPRGYLAGGAGDEHALGGNTAAFDGWRLVPRMLRDVSERDLAVTVCGTRLPAPALLAPVGVQSILHADAEVATARAARATGMPMVLSTASSTPMEEVARALGDTPRWFQLYWPKDPELTQSFVQRAEHSGYSAVVVTVDTTMLAWRPRDLRGAYLPFLRGEGIANYTSDPVFRGGLARSPEDDLHGAVQRFLQLFLNPALTWDDLARLRDMVGVPLLVKGIVHPDDARRAVDLGVDGIVVSNHGGRQVDRSVAPLDALPAVADAVGHRCDVLLDSGVRSGADLAVALALGARAVLLGRPYCWGLALAGAAGVEHVVRSFLADLDLTLALAGHREPATLSRADLCRAGDPPVDRESPDDHEVGRLLERALA